MNRYLIVREFRVYTNDYGPGGSVQEVEKEPEAGDRWLTRDDTYPYSRISWGRVIAVDFRSKLALVHWAEESSCWWVDYKYFDYCWNRDIGEAAKALLEDRKE